MIPIPDNDAPDLFAETLSGSILRGLPRAFAILFFSPDTRLGWMLVAISFLVPDLAVAGIAGVCAAAALAWILGFDRARIRNGYLLFNPLLVCLALAFINRSYHFSAPVFLALWSSAVMGGLFVAAAMQQWFSLHLALSAQSLPAVIAAYVLYFIAFAVAGPMTLPVDSPNALIDFNFLPAFWQVFFKTFGAMVFQPRVLPGVLVYLALAATSPLAALLASATFSIGAATMNVLGFPLGPESIVWCGFNFLLCGIALGTAYFAPSRASLLLAFVGTFLCALTALALSTALRYFGLPASALPYNLVVLTLVYSLRQRGSASGLHPSPAPGLLPEMAGRFVVLNGRRFPHLALPALHLPFAGERTITQSVNGSLTHRGPWRWAFDFEAMPNGQRCIGAGERLEDFYTFNTPVLSPCNGTVATVVSNVADNAPGMNNPDENWGNHIVIFSDAGYYVLLAHLREDAPLVFPGQRVVVGEMLGWCGNSGRSPVPHLHLQIQDSARAGAPTRPFCLKHFVETSATSATRIFRTSGIPNEGAQITAPAPLPELHAALSSWLPGEYRYRISRDDKPSFEETVLLDFDENGRFRFRSRRTHARLTAFLSENVFYATDYDGSGQSVLALIAAGLARVPCIADANLEWDDFVSAVPFYKGALRWLHDVVDPFIGPSLLTLRYQLNKVSSDEFLIECNLDSQTGSAPANAPQRIVTTLIPRRGVARITAHLRNDSKVTVELIDPSPEQSRPTNSNGTTFQKTEARSYAVAFAK